MRRIQNGIAAVITKEKLFNRRVVLSGFVILASAFASYMTMATYVPSLVHAHESESADKHESRNAIAREQSRGGSSEGSQEEESSSGGAGVHAAGDEESATSQSDDKKKSSDADVASRITSLPSDASPEAIADERQRIEREVRRGVSQSRSSYTSSPKSQFNAKGCSKRGTVTVRHHGKTVSWNNYGEYGQGTRGECVKSIQRKLNNHCNARLGVDGQYGPATQKAVQKYQRNMRGKGVTVNGSGIHVDGITGAQTFALMQHFGC